MIELTKEQRAILQEDILDRYDNEEYWNEDLLNSFLEYDADKINEEIQDDMEKNW